MTIPYNLNIPNGPDNPSADQPLMQTNTNSINQLIGVDHQSFSGTNAGWHTIIHQAIQVSNPSPVSGVTQIFSKNYTPDSTVTTTGSQLFLTNSGGTIQLSGTQQTSEGWAWVGGILIQWGQVLSTSATGNLIFRDRVSGAIPFPNNCFMVQATVSYGTLPPTSSIAEVYINRSTISRIGFTWALNATVPSQFGGFYWFAVGN